MPDQDLDAPRTAQSAKSRQRRPYLGLYLVVYGLAAIGFIGLLVLSSRIAHPWWLQLLAIAWLLALGVTLKMIDGWVARRPPPRG